jgi:hypothetical protein
MPRHTSSDPRRPKLVEAFGEKKTVAQWAADARSGVSAATIRVRLRRGEPAEEALTRTSFVPSSLRPREGKLWVAFGQALTVRQWTEDPRCKMAPRALRARLESGMDPEIAIMRPPSTHEHQFTAFGSTKSLAEWSKDLKCSVSLKTLCQRLERGWSFLRALTEAPLSAGYPTEKRSRARLQARRLLPRGDEVPVEAFGERKTLREWAADQRCQVPYSRLRMRLKRNWSLEEAIETVPAVGNRNVEAFGESKSLYEWEKDPRCQVTHKTLRYRMAQGESLEDAILRPPQNGGPRPRLRVGP